MTVSKSEKIRREAGRLMAAVSHSDFWRDAGFEPRDGTQNRQSELRQIARNIMSSDLLGEAINDDMEQIDSFPSKQQDNISIIQEEYQEQSKKNPSNQFARRIDEKVQGPEGVQQLWMEARSKGDFSICREEFADLVDLLRNYADKRMDSSDDVSERYQVLFEIYEDGIELDEVERLFEELEWRIKEILGQREFEKPSKSLKEFEDLSEAVEDPLSFHEEVVFDFLKADNDSILVQEGPYGMERGDALMAGMNTNSDQPWPKAVMTTVHEFGHVDYRSGLPDEYVYTPLGEPASDTIDEACARLWQVLVGYSRSFCDQLAELAERNGIEADGDEIFEALNSVNRENQIRIRADELTYQLHIIARFRVERRLINGDFEVEDLEEEWDREMSRVFPDYDPEIPMSEKFLQDVHWAKAKFGYYPTYTLGHLAAVQIYRNAERHIEDLEGQLSRANFEVLSEWLESNLYQHGSRFPTQELIRRASGEELSIEPFIEHIEERH